MNMKKTAIATALGTVLGVSSTAHAAAFFYDWTGTFTMINPQDVTLVNSDFAGNSTKGNQTGIVGTMVFNTSMTSSITVNFDKDADGTAESLTLGPGAGSATVNPFNFFGGGPALAKNIGMQAIGDGGGGPGTLVAGTMLFDWNMNNNISVEIVLDAAGFFSVTSTDGSGNLIMGGGAVAPDFEPRCIDVAFGFCNIALDDPAGGATSWIDQITGNAVNAYGTSTTVTGGPRFMATVDGNPFNTSDSFTFVIDPDGTAGNGDEYSTTINRHTNGISGINMDNGPFIGFNANFDVATMKATGSVSPIPVPAAVWLFGSGLIGLVGVARRRKRSV